MSNDQKFKQNCVLFRGHAIVLAVADKGYKVTFRGYRKAWDRWCAQEEVMADEKTKV